MVHAAAAISLQLSAHRRHISAQRFICSSLPNASQLSAHRRHISAQALQTASWALEPRNIASALVAQMSAHVESSLM
jgi:hypothetical protein